MSNPDYSEDFNKRKSPNPGHKTKPAAGSKPFPEKPSPMGGLPGKKQPRSRSGGTEKAKIYPKSDGL